MLRLPHAPLVGTLDFLNQGKGPDKIFDLQQLCRLLASSRLSTTSQQGKRTNHRKVSTSLRQHVNNSRVQELKTGDSQLAEGAVGPKPSKRTASFQRIQAGARRLRSQERKQIPACTPYLEVHGTYCPNMVMSTVISTLTIG